MQIKRHICLGHVTLPQWLRKLASWESDTSQIRALGPSLTVLTVPPLDTFRFAFDGASGRNSCLP